MLCTPSWLSRSLLCLTLACSLTSLACAPGEDDGGSAEDDSTRVALAAGTYELEGEAKHWAIQQLVLDGEGSYVARLYPGTSSPLLAQTQRGAYEVEEGSLTFVTARGNVLDSWQVRKRGTRYTFENQRNGERFVLRYTSDSTEYVAPPPSDVDPGVLDAEEGQASIECISEHSDVWLRAVVDEHGDGSFRLSSPVGLELGDQIEEVTVQRKYPNDRGEWLLVSGRSDRLAYTLHLTHDLVRRGGERQISLSYEGLSYYDMQTYGFSLVCSSTGTR